MLVNKAAKAIIVKDNKILLIRRRLNDVHSPGKWDIPGGRLEEGEDLHTGLRRETIEESNLEIEIVKELEVHHFNRDDGQPIKLTIFYCKFTGGELRLSEEHIEFKWVNLNSDIKAFPEWLHKSIELLRKHA